MSGRRGSEVRVCELSGLTSASVVPSTRTIVVASPEAVIDSVLYTEGDWDAREIWKRPFPKELMGHLGKEPDVIFRPNCSSNFW